MGVLYQPLWRTDMRAILRSAAEGAGPERARREPRWQGHESAEAHFFLSMSGMLLLSARSTMTCGKSQRGAAAASPKEELRQADMSGPPSRARRQTGSISLKLRLCWKATLPTGKLPCAQAAFASTKAYWDAVWVPAVAARLMKKENWRRTSCALRASRGTDEQAAAAGWRSAHLSRMRAASACRFSANGQLEGEA